mmetsp:Transcript_7295/g.13152  ORF Transcript_7295/g.13152 Transcript_7295/m.13152 type:complete len:1011 (+) Transcript_7295:372-3404(+)
MNMGQHRVGSRYRSRSGSDLDFTDNELGSSSRLVPGLHHRARSATVGNPNRRSDSHVGTPKEKHERVLRMRSPSFRMGAPRRVGSTHSPGYGPMDSPNSAPADMNRLSLNGYGTGTSQDVESISPVDWGQDSTKIQKIIESLIYGVVNSILTVPCMYGYTAIIFRAAYFQPYMADLAKLVLFSSVIHQCVFSIQSSLSFSIGQVQDAGLIFLSTMATSISKSTSDESIVPTTLVTLSISTAALGFTVYLIGRLRLAKLVSYLPMPVVGGYLAFIGFFCLEAGIGLSIGQDVSKVSDMKKMLNQHDLILVLPAMLGGALLAIVAKKAETWYSLPVCIVGMPLVFYAVLFATGTSITEAQNAGWMSKPSGEPIGPFWEVWELFEFQNVDWSVIPSQALTWISMTFVVSFSSCLDVVAIEMDMGEELDINHELCTVGLSNIMSGLTGGYTGSYIFSQTIFTYRTNTNSRLVGFIVIISELGLFMSPINVMEYVPLFFFAATLIFIAFDLLAEWLVEVRSKVSNKEYFVLLGTFLIITITNDLMMGIFIGIGLSILNFIIAYSSVTHIERVYKTTSNVVRDYDRRRVLAKHKQVVRFDLHGFLFFGSSMHIVQKLRGILDDQEKKVTFLQPDSDHNPLGPPDSQGAWWDRVVQGMWNKLRNGKSPSMEGGNEALLGTPPPLQRGQSNSSNLSSSTFLDDTIQFVVLDFGRVTGMDATAIATGLMRVKQIALVNGLTIVFTQLREDFEELLIANHVLLPNDPLDCCKVFDVVNDGLEWIEDQLLLGKGLAGRGSPKVGSRSLRGLEIEAPRDTPSMPDMPFALTTGNAPLRGHMSLTSDPKSKVWLHRILTDFFGLENEDETKEEWEDILNSFGLLRFREGDTIFKTGDDADSIYIVMIGEVSLFVAPTEPRNNTKPRLHQSLSRSKDAKFHLIDNGTLLQRARYGSIFGDIHYTLQQKREFSAVATEDSAVFFITRARFRDLEKHHPMAAIGLYQCLNKFLSLTVNDIQNYRWK